MVKILTGSANFTRYILTKIPLLTSTRVIHIQSQSLLKCHNCNHCQFLCLINMTATQSIHSCQWVVGTSENQLNTDKCLQKHKIYVNKNRRQMGAVYFTTWKRSRFLKHHFVILFPVLWQPPIHFLSLYKETDFFVLKHCILCTVSNSVAVSTWRRYRSGKHAYQYYIVLP